MTMETPKYLLEADDDARKSPVRLVVVQGERRPAVDAADEAQVMTWPHLMLREAIALVALSLALSLLAIFFDAPLEEIANAQKTPNPAKAPWYFLGLQELLHYYPPLVSGVILPGLVVVALIVIPYFNINLKREAFWQENIKRKLVYFWASILALSVIFLFSSAHPVWPILIPLWVIAGLMMVPAVSPTRTGWRGWLGDRSLAFWVFLWFLLASTALTVIGTFFRGPGWQYTIPWIDGVY
ncbi:MAG: hypothetical protein IPM55_15950 [Acidobacteria bacterium]|nr:hypothetical protein [Acidobacteriota bacterium]